MTKTGKYEEPAPNPQSVFVLNFENWNLRFIRAAQALAPRVEFDAWNLGFQRFCERLQMI